MADRLKRNLDPFELYRSGTKVVMRCNRCTEVVLSSQFRRSLLVFVQAAMAHDCDE